MKPRRFMSAPRLVLGEAYGPGTTMLSNASNLGQDFQRVKFEAQSYLDAGGLMMYGGGRVDCGLSTTNNPQDHVAPLGQGDKGTNKQGPVWWCNGLSANCPTSLR